MEVNLNLLNQRIKKNLKQWQLAAEIGVNATQYNKIERGFLKPSKEIKQRIANRLGVKIREIF